MSRTAVITGAATGIGRDTAKRFAAEGWNVAVHYNRSEAAAQSLVEELKARHASAIKVQADVRDPYAVKAMAEKVCRAFTRIDALVNSAGHGPRKPLLELSDEDWHKGIEVYFLNVVRAVRLVTPVMVRQKGGTIINISTAWAFEPSPMFPTSAVARAGLAYFTKLFADQYAPDNVRMNNVLPGWIDSLPATEERRQGVPMARYGKSEEIAATVAFLASEGAGYITGQNIRVDGGLMRSV